MKFDPEKFTKKAVSFIKQTVKRAGFQRVLVALSGGVDSATTLSLAVKALGPENVFVALLPCGELNKKGLNNSRLLINKLKLSLKNILEADIKPLIDKFIKLDKDREKTRKGNIMARVRMIILFDLAKKHKALVCGTENKSEHLLGYFTRFGDEASDLEPLRSLYKTQVYQLAKHLSIPQEILKTKPSAGLWKGQTNEGELGFSYEAADPILYLLYEKELSQSAVIKRGFAKELIDKVKKRVEENKFKHKTPYIFSCLKVV